MPRQTVINPLTGRSIQVGGSTFNRLIWNAYDYINGELIRRATAPPIIPRHYYYNIHTNRLVRESSRRFHEYIRAGWILEVGYYLVPPWLDAEESDTVIDIHRRQANPHGILDTETFEETYQQIFRRRREWAGGELLADLDRFFNTLERPPPVSYEQIIARHGERLVDLNVGLCKDCLIPIENESGEYCTDCKESR